MLETNQVVKISKNIRKEFPNLFLILNGPPLIASDIGFDGVHLPDKNPSQEWLESYKKNNTRIKYSIKLIYVFY